MNDLEQFLPSSKFTSTVLALLLAGGIVAVAHYGTVPKDTTGPVEATSNQAVDSDWQATLYAIQGNNASTSLPEAPTADDIAKQLAKAKTSNLTETVSRALAINLSNAKQQGLGDDAVSQDRIISDALTQSQSTSTQTYSLSDLRIVGDTDSTLHAYGNDAITTLKGYPNANIQVVLSAIASAVDTGSTKPLAPLSAASKDYTAAAQALLALPVPRSLASFHLVIVNDFFNTAAELDDARAFTSDPLRGLMGVQNYKSSLSEEYRMFINIANQFQKRSILFSKDEPGAAWGVLLNISPATSQS